MNLLMREQTQAQGASVTTYSPIAQSLNSLPEDERRKLRAKFDIAYFVATEQLAYRKYPRICQLEARHGVHLGSSHLHENAGKEFVYHIAKSRRQDLLSTISKAEFFSLLMDGSTDQSNADNEILLVLWCDPDGVDEKIHTRMSYLSIHKPHVTAEGLFQSLQHGLQCLGIQSVMKNTCSKLVGIATDGAAANVAGNGLKGLVEGELKWIFWMWCFAHRLELAIKDVLRGTFFFNMPDEMLLRLFYLYEKSPKKCMELESIVTDLKGAFQLDEGSGVRPIRACGTRWVCHKLSTMKLVLCKYGAYSSPCNPLRGYSMKSVDCAKFKGYLGKWVDAKYLLGCALFIDVLTPCAIFSKSMQADELDILGALTYLLRTVRRPTSSMQSP